MKYTQEQVEQMIDEATTETPATAEGWLKHYNGNISKCAEALGLSNATLRKHRDNGTLGDILIYNGRVYTFKNDVKLVDNEPEAEWEPITANMAGMSTMVNDKFETVRKPNIKMTRDPSTGRVQYWRKKNV